MSTDEARALSALPSVDRRCRAVGSGVDRNHRGSFLDDAGWSDHTARQKAFKAIRSSGRGHLPFLTQIHERRSAMSGPIVRTGTTPQFWKNWDRVFGKGKGKAQADSGEVQGAAAKAVRKVAKKSAGKKASGKAAPGKTS